MINLRGHHLFCTTLFSGLGYSEEFTENMKNVLKNLTHENIKIICKQDVLCAKCPFANENNSCGNGTDNATKRDYNAIKELNIKIDENYNYKQLLEKLGTVDEISFEKVCGNCQWLSSGVCSYEKFKEKLKMSELF